MSVTKFPVNNYENYHAHVYFEQDTLCFAADLCQTAGDLFALEVGRVHQKNVGPHPKWSCQLKFSSNEFEQFITWLENNRNGLSVLIHALTGDNLKDHTLHAYWLGDELPLTLAIFAAK